MIVISAAYDVFLLISHSRGFMGWTRHFSLDALISLSYAQSSSSVRYAISKLSSSLPRLILPERLWQSPQYAALYLACA